MITSFEDLRRVLGVVFPTSPPPKPLHLVAPIAAVRAGSQSLVDAAKQAGTTPRRLESLVTAPDPIVALLGEPLPQVPPRRESQVRSMLGQLVIGNLAERVFEEFYRRAIRTSELELRDDRSTRGDTDYLVLNGSGRQIFRINIKFHGSLFRRAKELVGLDPEDCFALATYKIYGALRKQDAEHLPYIFVIVGVPGLTGSVVGENIPDDLVQLSAVSYESPRITGKRSIEDQIVSRLADDPQAFGFGSAMQQCLEEIRLARWFVLSARRADHLLRELLFDRAYALRVRAFARNYGGAELDMHFSLTSDLRPLDEFLEVLHDYGMPGLVSRLERGTL